MQPSRSAPSRLALGNVFVAVAVLGLKLLAWWVTGSLALWSDALESVVNVAAAAAALIAVRLAEKPADRGHPYGHHKAEYFSAVLGGGARHPGCTLDCLVGLGCAGGAAHAGDQLDRPWPEWTRGSLEPCLGTAADPARTGTRLARPCRGWAAPDRG